MNQYDAIELAKMLAERSGKPVIVTQLSDGRGAQLTLDQKPPPGRTVAVIHPLRK